ncbi:MAG: ACP S-malonyltransferase [Thermotogae bacterium]|nr:ACP S-malonyltransferase [Thermotogota bacterium]RKX54109.1 MAG: [acyl-carrier-protein] S-malonyltransferase [Thermotoga sp.]
MRAFVFPGQGSQFVGMGKELYESSDIARKVMNDAVEILGYDIKNKIFNGTEEELKRTSLTQPSIFIVSVMYLEYLKKEGFQADVVAGHSLGEFTALVAAGVIDFETGLKLVQFRGRIMEETAGDGGMLAVIGLNLKEVEKVVEENGRVDLANINSQNQIIISGPKDELRKLSEELKRRGARRIVELKVGAPFHSRYMKEVERKLEEYLKDVKFSKPSIPIVQNYSARESMDPEEIKRNIVKQTTGTVRWYESVLRMSDMGVDEFVEVGPGKVLTNLIKRIIGNIVISSDTLLAIAG